MCICTQVCVSWRQRTAWSVFLLQRSVLFPSGGISQAWSSPFLLGRPASAHRTCLSLLPVLAFRHTGLHPAFTWVLGGFKLWSSHYEASALPHWTISPALLSPFIHYDDWDYYLNHFEYTVHDDFEYTSHIIAFILASVLARVTVFCVLSCYKYTIYYFYNCRFPYPSKLPQQHISVILNLWVKTPLGVEWYYRGKPKPVKTHS